MKNEGSRRIPNKQEKNQNRKIEADRIRKEQAIIPPSEDNSTDVSQYNNKPDNQKSIADKKAEILNRKIYE